MSTSSSNLCQRDLKLQTPHLLIATSKCHGTPFAKKLVLLQYHGDQGSYGMIINEPLPVSLGDLLHQLQMPTQLPWVSEHRVLSGGPVQQDRGHILTRESASDTQGEWLFTGQKQALRRIARGEGPKDFVIAVGHTRWKEKQLMQELKQGVWLLQPVHVNLLFRVPIEDRWDYAQSKLGFDMRQMSHMVGHG